MKYSSSRPKLFCAALLAASGLFAGSVRAAVDLANFGTNPPTVNYFGSWNIANSPVVTGMLAIGSADSTGNGTATPSGGGNLAAGFNLSGQNAIQLMAAVPATNQAMSIQINLGNTGGNQAIFTFTLSSFGTTKTTVTLPYSSAFYADTNFNPIPQSSFNYAAITNFNIQGNYANSTEHIVVSVYDVSAVPEPSELALLGLGGLSALYLYRRNKLAERNHFA